MGKNQASGFPATRWSLVDQAASISREEGFRALSVLLDSYRYVLVRYLVKIKRFPEDRAEDLVQAFVCDKILEGCLIRQADASRGKFRTFLLTSLNRYVIDTLRKERAARRHPGEGALLPLDDLEEVIADTTATRRSFDLEWVRRLIAHTLENVERECARKNRMDIWHIFHARVVHPILSGDPPPAYDTLVEENGLDSPRRAQNALITGKRMFQRHLVAVVMDYVEDEDEAKREIEELMSICSHS